jgi:hypothetical protein
MLGETPPQPASVFDLLSPEDRARLFAVREATRKAAAAASQAPATAAPSSPPAPAGARLTEWEQKAEEARRKVVGEMIANRFQASGVEFSSIKNEKPKEPEPEPDSSHDTAAEMKMFGKLTREVKEWRPENLLCKRFNVRNPFAGKEKARAQADLDLLPTAMELGVKQIEPPKAEPKQKEPEPSRSVPSPVAEEEREEVVMPKPPIDLFKAIFQDDDEDFDLASLLKGAKSTAPEPVEIDTKKRPRDA